MQWIELGRIKRPFGVKGWLHVESYTEPCEALLEYRQWMLKSAAGARRAHTLAEGRLQGRELVVRLEGLQDREAAQALVGAVVEVDRAELPPTRAKEYYRADLVGLAVSNRQGADLGVLKHFVDGANGAMMVMEHAASGALWVPATPAHLWKVDLAAGRIIVDWPLEP